MHQTHSKSWAPALFYLLAGILHLTATASLTAAEGEIPVTDVRTTFVDRVSYSAGRTGVIAEVPDEGATVNQEDIIVRLRDEVPRAVLAVAAAKAASDVAIRAAEKTARAAELEHDAAAEANHLAATGNPAYPPTHITRLRLQAEAAKLQVGVAEHEREIDILSRDQAQAELESFWIPAEYSGTVTKVFKHAGEGVQQGEAIVQVVNTDRLRVEGYVTDEQAFVVKVGMPVLVRFDLPESLGEGATREFVGKLGYVDVSTAPLAKRVRVWADVENRQKLLKEGMSATMVIHPTAEGLPPLPSPPTSNEAALDSNKSQ